ncbi:hypothetical protein CLIB1423_02S08834 [[Candida] railenensis]|uniref:Uncharacterized protein n=1 Tax=[Candida] railenensis TaxID=45579 RepID=A0A9P0QM61_9ASCO|nr:hypothetical protein CLIB1423_02S08834 [[Candida] railenensis]
MGKELAFLGSELPGIESAGDLTFDNVVTCRAVKAIPGKDASITVKYQGGKQSIVPILIFRYIYIDKFDWIPDWDKFVASKDHGFLNEENAKFEVKPKEDGLVFLNSVVSAAEPEVKLNVTESGIYCLYARPAASDHEFTVSALAHNSYGYLIYPAYLVYTQLKYYIFLGLILFGLLFNYILRFKVGDDFTDLNSISIISKATLFYVLAPAIGISFLQMCGGFLANNFEFFSGHHPIVLMVPAWLQATYEIALRFFILLFSMGYGVIYCHGQDSQKYRRIPDNLWKRATTLLSINFVTYTVYVLMDKFFPLKEGVVTPSGIISGLELILRFAYLLFPMIWFVFTIIHYFRTKQTISKFPVTSNVDENDKLLGAFRKSISVIFILPMVVGILAGIITGKKLMADSILPPYGAEGRELDAFYAKLIESVFFNENFTYVMVWTSFLTVFATIGGIFAIWTKNNYGIILESKEDMFDQAPAYSDIDSVEP